MPTSSMTPLSIPQPPSHYTADQSLPKCLQTPRNSQTHPIQLSELLPPTTHLPIPPGKDLLDVVLARNKAGEGLIRGELKFESGREEVEEVEAGIKKTSGMTTVEGPSSKQANFYLSSCPGKKVRLTTGPVHGRAMIDRDLNSDFTRLASFGIRAVICCLNDSELKYLGAPYPEYLAAAQSCGMQVLRIPMIEGSSPTDFPSLHTIILAITQLINSGTSVLCHCRGGVGRAGLVACCYLLYTRQIRSPDRSIRYVRIMRSPKAIETMRQEDYIKAYAKWLTEN
ncbi:protein-tyrosine phosphatase-like protein [Phlyctochytrium arcticum]|nr:protein-tyrosine phosphatase-like protein [Phlyctochytrium arcticum]